MFWNRTYVNRMSFSDRLVTFKFEGISILHLTGIFSCNFIFFENLFGLIRNDLFRPFQTTLWGLSCIWRCYQDFQGNGWKPIKWAPSGSLQHRIRWNGKNRSILINPHKISKIIKLQEKIPVNWRIEIPSNIKVTSGQRDCVHVSTVQEHIFHFRIYLLFEIFTVFVLMS